MEPVTIKSPRNISIDESVAPDTPSSAPPVANSTSKQVQVEQHPNFTELKLPPRPEPTDCGPEVTTLVENVGRARPLRASDVSNTSDSKQLQRSLDKFLSPQRQNTVSGFEMSERCDNSNSLQASACYHPATNSITVTKSALESYRNGEISSIDYGAAIVHELAHASGVGEFCAYKAGDAYALRHGGEQRFTNDDDILKHIHSIYTPAHYSGAVIERFNGQISAEAMSWLPGGAQYNEMNLEHKKMPTKYAIDHEQTAEYQELLEQNRFPEKTDPDILFGAVQYRFHHFPQEREALAAFSNDRTKLPEPLQKELSNFLTEYNSQKESHVSHTPSTDADYLNGLQNVATLANAQVQMYRMGNQITATDLNNVDQKLYAAVDELTGTSARRTANTPLLEASAEKEREILNTLGNSIENSLRTFPTVEQRPWTDEDTTQLHAVEKNMVATLGKLETALRTQSPVAEIKSIEEQFHTQLKEFDNQDSLRLDNNVSTSTFSEEFQTTRNSLTTLFGKVGIAYTTRQFHAFAAQ